MLKKSTGRTQKQLFVENEALRARLDEAEETLRAIRSGEVDAHQALRKQAEKALLESEEQFRALVKNLKSGVALVDEDGRFTVVNPSFMQIFGLDNKLDILNVNSQDWSRWEVYGEDGKLLHVDDHPVRKAAMTGKPAKNQLIALRNPGANEFTWLLVSSEPTLKEDGHKYRVICTYHDITERRQMEEALKKARDSLE